MIMQGHTRASNKRLVEIIWTWLITAPHVLNPTHWYRSACVEHMHIAVCEGVPCIMMHARTNDISCCRLLLKQAVLDKGDILLSVSW